MLRSGSQGESKLILSSFRTFTIPKTNSQPFTMYGLVFVYKKDDLLFFPTFCKTPQGLRLYGTRYAMNEKGPQKSTVSQAKTQMRIFQILKLTECRTVQLTSSLEISRIHGVSFVSN
jgi:hypothetical protein